MPTDDRDHYRAVDPRTQEEVGDVLERAFRREDGREPREEEVRRFLALAEEAERGAETAESLAREAEQAAAAASERYGLTGGSDDLAAVERWTGAAQTYRREAESLRLEAERLRYYA
ncbi:MAG: hypothetical protein ACYC5O_15285 [Anaerolineae bacterium]